jgi:hypothetical protein
MYAWEVGKIKQNKLNSNDRILITHSWSQDLLEKPPVVQLLKNFPAFFGNRRFITMFTKPSTAPYPEPDQSSPYQPILYL